jgi:hypothetical protein
MSARESDGLAARTPRKSGRVGERASEAGPGWQSPAVGGGSAFEIRRASVGSSGHPAMEGASGALRASVLDGIER